MSMPQFPNADEILTRDEAINAILTSIAMEEAALSHIINAEGEKIQYVLQHVDTENCCKSMCFLLRVNNSVSVLIDQITDLQLILKNKMRIAASMVAKEDACPPEPFEPIIPPVPPCPPEPPHPPVHPAPPIYHPCKPCQKENPCKIKYPHC
ncbi:MAG: hypothetical protein FWC16_07805 [Defluviitaleaceae bacterium]|nr:hypothetical protein [Defluviitaleaceae bacterium]MCL2274819.1 hypothetical protein [Defluviitaleaceae bacterium]